jgi:hypothetical protein
LLTYYSGTWWAKYWGWAHEHFSKTATWEKKIDLHNNWIGRMLGSHLHEVAWAGPAPMARELCAGAWNRGWPWTRVNGVTTWSDGSRVSSTWLAKYQPDANFGKEGG